MNSLSTFLGLFDKSLTSLSGAPLAMFLLALLLTALFLIGYAYKGLQVVRQLKEAVAGIAAAKAAGCPIQSLGIAEGQYQDYVVSHTLERLHDKGDGYYIGIKDGVYYMGDVGLKGASAFRSEELPAGVRGKIGMLKLVPDDTFVAGVGVRCSDTRFYILP